MAKYGKKYYFGIWDFIFYTFCLLAIIWAINGYNAAVERHEMSYKRIV